MGQQSFSIYLLKENFNESNSIKGKYKHQLIKLSEKEWDNQELPDASLYLQVNEPKPPVWKNYFNITKDIQNQSQGSVLFIPISAQGQSRYFAITFGHTYHALLKQSIDHNFGLITTLNALKPGESIRAIDTVFPENDRRERIQSPNFTHLEFFHFNKHESLVKSLHGKVKDEYRDVFNNITGTLSFKCNSQKPLSELKELCTKLFEIFSKKDYEDEFPELIHIKPENDPDKIHE
ncbi:TPA: TIGR04141 family sporadically distributed protein, partial [Mannheimia haemolytica]|nr:TIGR04141 family sporadically distributed protein [Mannheimia haemolytica]